MDAVEFLKEKGRMCRTILIVGGFVGRCDECEIGKRRASGQMCDKYIVKHPEEAVAIVEQWAKEHPRKTRQSEFLKMFPEARLFDGVLAIDPCKINSPRFDSKECRTYSDEFGVLSCDKCREQFWNEEVDQ